jgi:2-hydroxy-3-keto-5-methylthiopentenyl-1-phosphate phosphatase
MAGAGAVPPLRPGDLPVSVLVDYDGTVSVADVGDVLLARLGPPAEIVAAADREYHEGRRGSRELTCWDMDHLPDDEALLRAEAADVAQDPGFPGFVREVRGAGAILEVVSDGLGFYVESKLRELEPSLADLPVATNVNAIRGGGSGVSFPYGHPACFVCGTCKRERVLAHRASGRFVVLVGDGASDRYAAHHADLVFAKRSLLAWMLETGRPVEPWHGFGDLAAWFRSAVADGILPGSADEVRALREAGGDPGFICGPEAWGPGRSAPPAP